MKTGTLVAGMTGAGILGGVVGAFLFLTFFADSFRPESPREGPVAERGDPQFSEEEARDLRRLPGQVEELRAGIQALRTAQSPPPMPIKPLTEGPSVPVEVAGDPETVRKNEGTAIAILRNSASCQAQIQTSGKIDSDSDGIGEYGTFLEMTGTVAVRGDSDSGQADFSRQKSPVSPAIMSPSLANVDADGIVTRNGFCFRIFLPDTSSPAGFVHERGPGHSVGLTGGTGMISVNMAETTWCMYAWPVSRGVSGNRVFFVNQAGDVLQSTNEAGRYDISNPPLGDSAFTGAGITSRLAIGTRGNDGDVWKVTN